MTPLQYRAVLKKLDLTQLAMARLLRVNDVTSRRWAKSGVNGTAAILIRLLDKGTISAKDVERVR